MNTYAASVGLLWATAFRAVGIPEEPYDRARTYARSPSGIFAEDQHDRREPSTCQPMARSPADLIFTAPPPPGGAE